MNDTDRLVQLLRPASRILVFTGAGVSTGSGIPDFRGPNGLWKRRQPVYFNDFLASEQARVEYWDQKAEGWESFRTAQPNAAHRALVRLEELGRLRALVTQNIDGLHQAAGSSASRLIEVHGTNRRVECLDCGELTDPDPSVDRFRAERRTPTCLGCGGLLKFATVSFGQSLKPGVLESAAEAAADCDLVLALGSTLSVHPAASIPLIGAQGGAPYVIVNAGDTEQDAAATLRIEGDVTIVLPPAVAELEPV